MKGTAPRKVEMPEMKTHQTLRRTGCFFPHEIAEPSVFLKVANRSLCTCRRRLIGVSLARTVEIAWVQKDNSSRNAIATAVE
jgi:hypothetical protein